MTARNFIERRTTAAELIHALGGKQATGMCRCPAHDDEKPSLHVKDGNKNVVFHCHAGCSQQDVVAALKFLGIWGGASSWAPAAKHDDRPPPDLEAYERFREAFSLLRAAAWAEDDQPDAYLRTRGIDSCPPCAMLLPKRESRALLKMNFPAMVLPITDGERLTGAQVTHLNARGDDKLSGISVPRRTYGRISGGYVPLGEAAPDKPLIVGEGVETVLSAMQITGYPGIATLGTSGMRSVRVPPCSEVIIAADNDNAGRVAAKELAYRLRLRGTPVRVAVPDGADKYDWNDALLSGASTSELRDAITKAKLRRPSDSIVLGAEDFMKLEFPQRDFLLKPWLTTASINMIHASRGVGKSMLAMAIGHAVGRGGSLLKWNCKKAVPVLYVDGELPGALLQKRLGYLSPKPTNGQLLVVNRDRVVKMKKARLDLAQEEDRDLLDDLIERNGVGLIILDSILTLFTSDTQRDAQPWVAVQDWAFGHRDAGRSVIFIHHDSKSGGAFGTMLREVQMDVVIHLKSDSKIKLDDDESAFRLLFTKTRDQFGTDIAPMVVRYSTPEGALAWQCETESADTRTRVLELVNEGWKQKDIATELGLSESAISQHVAKLTAAGELK